MASWSELIQEIESCSTDQQKSEFLLREQRASLESLSGKRGGTNVIFYASAFLQKPLSNQLALSLTHEEINGFMSVMYGMDWAKGLTLVLHTPGGVTNATETIVAYLNSKFEKFEVIVPTYAMSAGTMISLASDNIVMGRQSQLGPIDPQMPIGGRPVSARSIVDQFERAKKEILDDVRVAHVWAPILQTIGPAVLQEAQNALDYGERMVSEWLTLRMCKGDPIKAKKIASHFNAASEHKSHGRRIDREEARAQDICIENLEDDPELQDVVLTNYHLATIMFEKSPATKAILSNNR
jgi:ClpP class serine protease